MSLEENKKAGKGSLSKPLQIHSETHKNLRKLSGEHGRSMKEFIAQMVNYFKRTGIDPLDIKTENSTSAIKALDKRLIGFIKTQEKEKLIPLLDELSILSKTIHQKLTHPVSQESFNESIKGLSSNQKKIFEEIKKFDAIKIEIEELKKIIEGKQSKKGFF